MGLVSINVRERNSPSFPLSRPFALDVVSSGSGTSDSELLLTGTAMICMIPKTLFDLI